MITLSPTSAVPPWFYGIFFILIFAAVIRILPFGGMVDSPPPANPVDFALSVLKHLILPASSLIISSFFLSIYNWRTFFLIYSSEDYVEMAKAKACLRVTWNAATFCAPPCPPSSRILHLP